MESIREHWAARGALAVKLLPKGQGILQSVKCTVFLDILANWLLRIEKCLFPLSYTACYNKQPQP